MQDTELMRRILIGLAVASAAAWSLIFRRVRGGQRLVPYEPRRQVPWNGIDVAVVICTALVLIGIVSQSMFRYLDVDPSDTSTSSYVSAMLAASLASGIAVLVATLVYLVGRGVDLQSVGINARCWAHDFGIGIVGALAVDFPLLMIQGVLTQFWPSKHPLIEVMREHPSREALAATAVLAVVVAPIVEELIFRVVVQGWLERLVRTWRRTNSDLRGLPVGAIPIILSAALFAAAHAHGPDPIPIFLLGLALGYVYHQTHRILPSMAMHMCFNGVTVVLLAASLKSV